MRHISRPTIFWPYCRPKLGSVLIKASRNELIGSTTRLTPKQSSDCPAGHRPPRLMQFLPLLLLGSLPLSQMSLAVVCFRRYPGARIPALLLGVASPLPIVAAFFGESF